MSDTVSSYQQLAAQYAEQYGFPVQAFLDRITNESSWDPNAVNSSSGAIGLGQILPSTAANPGYGIQPVSTDALTDPATNLNFSAALLAAYTNATGSISGALAKYTGQPQSNFTQYDPYSTTLDNAAPTVLSGATLGAGGQVTSTFQNSSVSSATSGNQDNTTTLSGLIGHYFVEAAVVVLGMIFVAIGLKMLTSGQSATQVVTTAAGKVGEAAAVAG